MDIEQQIEACPSLSLSTSSPNMVRLVHKYQHTLS